MASKAHKEEELQDWERKQMAEWRKLFEPYLVTEEIDGEHKAHCPIHEDKNPSANVNLRDGVWYCFGCGKGGPIDNLYPMLTSRLENDFVPPWVSGKMIDSAPSDAEPLPTENNIANWHENLLNDPDAMEYLRFTRGLREAEIRKRRLVIRPDRKAGVRYGFPVYEESQLVNVRWYTPQNPVRNEPKRVWSVRGHGTARLYPYDVIEKSEAICIVEGEFDSLLLNSWNIPAVTSTAGAGKSSKRWNPDWNELFEDKTVYIVPDRDVPGMEYAYHLAEQLKDWAYRIALVELPFDVTEDHGKDVSDFLLVGTQPDTQVDAFRGMLQRAAREAKLRNLSRDPEVRKWKRHIRRREHAAREVRREEVLEAFTEPPSTMSLKEELSLALPPFNYTIDRLHPEGSTSLLRSAYKVGKSTLLLNLVRSLADGEQFLGMYDVHQPKGRIAFWNYEVSRVQFALWAKSMKVKNQDAVAVWNLRGYHLPLDVDEVFEEAVEWLIKREVKALVIDPYSRAYAGDENDNSAVGAWLDRVDELKRQAGVDDVFMSAHFGRGSEERARGAARLEDWADSLWTLNREDADRYFSADGRDVEVPESRLEFEAHNRRLTIVGGSREEEKMNTMVEIATHLVQTFPGERTHAQLVSDLAGHGTAPERNKAVQMAAEQGRITLDHSVTPARYRPKSHVSTS